MFNKDVYKTPTKEQKEAKAAQEKELQEQIKQAYKSLLPNQSE